MMTLRNLALPNHGPTTPVGSVLPDVFTWLFP